MSNQKKKRNPNTPIATTIINRIKAMYILGIFPL